MTKNVLAKLAYVQQNYQGYSEFTGVNPNDLYGGKFNGVMIEAINSF
jgi:hypothetical protein